MDKESEDMLFRIRMDHWAWGREFYLRRARHSNMMFKLEVAFAVIYCGFIVYYTYLAATKEPWYSVYCIIWAGFVVMWVLSARKKRRERDEFSVASEGCAELIRKGLEERGEQPPA
jgi:Flp pilus assembly protein TadB